MKATNGFARIYSQKCLYESLVARKQPIRSNVIRRNAVVPPELRVWRRRLQNDSIRDGSNF